MNSAPRTLLSWIGRLALLAVPLVLVLGFTYPDAIQVLNPVVCTEGLELDVQTRDPDTPFDNRPVCDSERRMVDADDRLYIVAACAGLIAIMAYTLRSRITPRSLSAPQNYQHR